MALIHAALVDQVVKAGRQAVEGQVRQRDRRGGQPDGAFPARAAFKVRPVVGGRVPALRAKARVADALRQQQRHAGTEDVALAAHGKPEAPALHNDQHRRIEGPVRMDPPVARDALAHRQKSRGQSDRQHLTVHARPSSRVVLTLS